MSNLELRRRLWGSLLLAAVWTVAVWALFGWNVHSSAKHAEEMALQDARATFSKDHAIRAWASGFGGVYVPVGPNAQPSPHLEHIPDRDVVTQTGKQLTLMNPATMVLQIMESHSKLYGIRGRLVSIAPLEPKNAADPWEEEAIERLELGEEEVIEIASIDDQPHLRLLKPMVAFESCLKCHEIQGYGLDDVIGGVGVDVPMEPYYKSLVGVRQVHLISHGSTWFIGILGLFVWHRRGIARIRERTEANETLVAAYADLETLVERRTEQLEDAKKVAMDANQAKSQFLANMSHELRTPLNAIVGFADLLKMEFLGSERQNEWLDHIDDASEHLLNLIEEVLDLAKIESGHMESNLETLEMWTLVQECATTIEPLAHKKGISVRLRQDDIRSGTVYADRRRTTQVLLNLLSNAVKYNNDDGTILVSITSIDDDGLRVSVTDSGPGIPADKHADVFSIFNRLGAEKSEIEGTGVGLTLSKTLVEMMGGAIGFDSAEGKGTTFWFTLPELPKGTDIDAATDDLDAIMAPQMLDAVEEQGFRVFHIEDNRTNLLLVETIVGRMTGATFGSARSAEDGLPRIADEKPDVILMDVNLPGMDGMTAARTLKADENLKDIPIIGISANAMPESIKAGFESGFDAYLTKPFRARELIQALTNTLRNRKA